MTVWLGSPDSLHIPEALIFEVLGSIPAKSLLRFRCVCKTWLKLIDSHAFITAHTIKTLQQQSNRTTRIFIHRVDRKQENQSQEPLNLVLFPPFDESAAAQVCRKLYILELENGKAKVELFRGITSPCSIIDACNGLILLNLALAEDEASSRLVVMNPLTGKFTSVPPGTNTSRKIRCGCRHLKHESYAFSYIPSTSDYKLVHLFLDELGYVQCEFLNVSTRLWKPVIDWPTFRLDHHLDGGINLHSPFEALGAAHWSRLIVGDSLLSVGIEDNKIYKIKLPEKDQAEEQSSFHLNFEMDGYLCSGLYCSPTSSIGLWLLKDLSGTSWIKHYTIKNFSINLMLYARDTKEIICDESIRIISRFETKVERNMVAYGLQQGVGEVRRRVEILGDPDPDQLIKADDKLLSYIHSLET